MEKGDLTQTDEKTRIDKEKYLLLGFGSIIRSVDSYKVKAYYTRMTTYSSEKIDSVSNYKVISNGSKSYDIQEKYISLIQTKGLSPGSIINKRFEVIKEPYSYKEIHSFNLTNLSVWTGYHKPIKYQLNISNYLPGINHLSKEFLYQYSQSLIKGLHYNSDNYFDKIIFPSYIIFKNLYMGSRYLTETFLNYGNTEQPLIFDSHYDQKVNTHILIVNKRISDTDIYNICNLKLLVHSESIINNLSNHFRKNMFHYKKSSLQCRFPEEDINIRVIGKVCIENKGSEILKTLYVYDIKDIVFNTSFPNVNWNRNSDTRRANKDQAIERKYIGEKIIPVTDNNDNKEFEDLDYYDPRIPTKVINNENIQDWSYQYKVKRIAKIEQKTKTVYNSFENKDITNNNIGGSPNRYSNNISTDINNISDFRQLDLINKNFIDYINGLINQIRDSLNIISIKIINNKTGKYYNPQDTNNSILSTFYTENTKYYIKRVRWCYYKKERGSYKYPRKVMIIEININNRYVYIFDCDQRFSNRKFRLLVINNYDYNRFNMSQINSILIIAANHQGKWMSKPLEHKVDYKIFNHNETINKRIIEYLRTITLK